MILYKKRRDMAMRIPNITNYKPKEFAALLNVTVKTLQRWDRGKILVANRRPRIEDIIPTTSNLQFKGIEKIRIRVRLLRYARVSSRKQHDLENQVDLKKQHCRARMLKAGLSMLRPSGDYGSGPGIITAVRKWNQLLDAAGKSGLDILVPPRDRREGFGSDWSPVLQSST